jgi:hypothetical protein
MGKRRKINPQELKKRTDALINFIYENDLERDFEQYSPYHFRLKGKIDVWPISQKFYVRGTTRSQVYGSVGELKKLINNLC